MSQSVHALIAARWRILCFALSLWEALCGVLLGLQQLGCDYFFFVGLVWTQFTHQYDVLSTAVAESQQSALGLSHVPATRRCVTSSWSSDCVVTIHCRVKGQCFRCHIIAAGVKGQCFRCHIIAAGLTADVAHQWFNWLKTYARPPVVSLTAKAQPEQGICLVVRVTKFACTTGCTPACMQPEASLCRRQAGPGADLLVDSEWLFLPMCVGFALAACLRNI
jgi:hypothetical protein